MSCLQQSAPAVCSSIAWRYVNLWDMTSPHNTCPCWDSCSKWGGRGASFEALSKRDDILGSELKALAIISHEWRLTETISSYSNFVLPWFNSAFWSSDCFIMYSSKSSRPKLPISRSWTSLRSESFSREVSPSHVKTPSHVKSVQTESESFGTRIRYRKCIDSCQVNLVTFKPIQKQLMKSEKVLMQGGSAHWHWASEPCLEQICKVSLKATCDSVILVYIETITWRTFENCLTDR